MKSDHISYGGYGGFRGILPSGEDIDLTVTPWRYEGGGRLLDVNGVVWVVTSTWIEELQRGWVLLRPFGEKASIVVEASSADFNVVQNNGVFTVAYNSERGQLSVVTFPVTAPRYALLP